MATFQSQYTGNQIETAIGKALQMEETFTAEEKAKVDAIDTEFVQDINQIKAKTDKISTTSLTYYVDATNGSDSNDGLTSATAFKTIGKAVSMCKAVNISGDFSYIRIAGGTYNEGISFANFNSTVILTIYGDVVLNGTFTIYSSTVLVRNSGGNYSFTVYSINIYSNGFLDFLTNDRDLLIRPVGNIESGITLSRGGRLTTYTCGVDIDMSQSTVTSSKFCIHARSGGEINNNYGYKLANATYGLYLASSRSTSSSASYTNVDTHISKLYGGQALTGAGIDLT